MKIKVNELLTQLIVISSTIMLTFTGVITINYSKYCLFLVLGLSVAKILFIRVTVKQFWVLLITLISLMWQFIAHDEAVANQLIFFGSLILVIDLFRHGIEQFTWKLLKICTLIACVWLVLESRSNDAVDLSGRIVLFFDNPNMTGIALCAPTMILLIMFVEEKRTTIRGLYAALAAAMVFLVYRTENRGSFFTLLVFVAFVLLSMIKKKSIRMTSKTVFAVLKLMPIIVMLLYVFLYTVLPKDLELLGKPFFSGREYAWKLAIEQLIHNPFGQNHFDSGTLNLFLEGVRRYGIFSMIGYFWILFSMSKTDLKTAAPRSYLAYLGFHLYLFQQSFESTLITGSYSVYVWTYVLLGIASMHEPDEHIPDLPDRPEARRQKL